MKLRATSSLPQWPRGIIYEEEARAEWFTGLQNTASWPEVWNQSCWSPAWQLPQGVSLCGTEGEVKVTGGRKSSSAFWLCFPCPSDLLLIYHCPLLPWWKHTDNPQFRVYVEYSFQTSFSLLCFSSLCLNLIFPEPLICFKPPISRSMVVKGFWPSSNRNLFLLQLLGIMFG